ncbi:unnamed protein product [Effrenium voratum]|uniref:Uncharacterized protein n=1 Tax=Effrenium voratum TaxID=2562239 RepID=A0AA36NKF2_9DINO|nr:unnamed protein product [Effrenium voratum]
MAESKPCGQSLPSKARQDLVNTEGRLRSFESLVHASPKAIRSPKTPPPGDPDRKSPSSPLSPLSRGLSFFPEERLEELGERSNREKRVQSSKRSVHFDRPASSSASLSGNASSLLSRFLGRAAGPSPDASPVEAARPSAAEATRRAVRERLARQEDRGVVPKAKMEIAPLPVLLGSQPVPASGFGAGAQDSCAVAARRAFLAYQERRASRAMTNFVV